MSETSGKKFETGAVRSGDAEATRYDLISPVALEALARTCAEGAAKYSDFNWERGMPAHDLLNHALRHIFLFLSGDRSEEHLPHAMWNVGGAIHSIALWPELNKGKLRGPGCTPPLAVSIPEGTARRSYVNDSGVTIVETAEDWYARHGKPRPPADANRYDGREVTWNGDRS